MDYKFRQLKFPVLGRVRDHEKALWDVRDVRTTKHGFDLLFGSRVIAGVEYLTGLPRLIATRELVDFWETHRIRHDGIIFDLPAGRTTLKRVRRRLGFQQGDDHREFFEERLEDLRTLSSTQFASRHNVPAHVASDTRLRLIGRVAREIDWWQTPEILAMLRSKLLLREIAERLDIGTSHAARLRKRVREIDRGIADLPKERATVELLEAHIDELKASSIEQFAAAHNLSFNSVAKLSVKVMGRRGRPLDWWKSPRALAILLSNASLRQICKLLNLRSTSNASRLRRRAQAFVGAEQLSPMDLAA